MVSSFTPAIALASVAVLVAAVLLASPAAAGTAFVAIGDWGCGKRHAAAFKIQQTVAASLASVAASLNAEFVVNLGDNFYSCGIASTTDKLWTDAFEDVYTNASLMVPWYSVLGNHDYGFDKSPEHEMAYVSPKNNRWVLPARYYTKTVTVAPGVNATFIFLDSSPCMQQYRNDDGAHWDPPKHVCEDEEEHYDRNGKYAFHTQILAQDCETQHKWVKSVLPTIPAANWKIAVSHAPFYQLDVEPIHYDLSHAGVDLFLSGHVHVLRQYEMDGKKDYVITGAGCQNPDHAGDKRTVWNGEADGFTSHSFSDDGSSITTTFYKHDGEVLHKFVTTR
jgi:tartrate-resistant acid phosphatase type 5